MTSVHFRSVGIGMTIADQVDLFRLRDGMIIEHWDDFEPVPPQAEWANSGKF